MDLSVYDNDPTLYLFTSLTAGSSHIVTATSRIETILKANKVPFKGVDTATDDLARSLYGRRARGKKLPFLVKEGMVIADLEQIEEWNEYDELKEALGVTAAAPAAKPAASTITAQAQAPKENVPAVTPAQNLAIRQLGAEAAKVAASKKAAPANILTTNPLLSEKTNSPSVSTPTKSAGLGGILSPKSIPLPTTPNPATAAKGKEDIGGILSPRSIPLPSTPTVGSAGKDKTASSSGKDKATSSNKGKISSRSGKEKSSLRSSKDKVSSKSSKDEGSSRSSKVKTTSSSSRSKSGTSSSKGKSTSLFGANKSSSRTSKSESSSKPSKDAKEIKIPKPGDVKPKLPPSIHVDAANPALDQPPVSETHTVPTTVKDTKLVEEASKEEIKKIEEKQAIPKVSSEEEEDEESEEEDEENEEEDEESEEEENEDEEEDEESEEEENEDEDEDEDTKSKPKTSAEAENSEDEDSQEEEEDSDEEVAPTAPQATSKAKAVPAASGKSEEEDEDEDEESEEESDEEVAQKQDAKDAGKAEVIVKD